LSEFYSLTMTKNELKRLIRTVKFVLNFGIEKSLLPVLALFMSASFPGSIVDQNLYPFTMTQTEMINEKELQIRDVYLCMERTDRYL
jgi:hypothetical protein